MRIKNPTAFGIFLSLLFMIFLSPSAFSLDRIAPGTVWWEKSGPRFVVVFPEGYSSLGDEVYRTAEQVYANLTEFWQEKIRGKIRILVVLDSDVGSGFATFFPYNTIRIDLAQAQPDEMFSGGRSSWLKMILVHEMTHLLIMNKSSGFFYALRRLFGHMPLAFPMVQYPTWLHEGLSVYSESRLCDSGRLNTPDYIQMINSIARADAFRGYLAIRGNSTQWPGPLTPYLYGAELVRYLVDRFGEESLRLLVEHLRMVPVSLGISPRFKRVFGMGIRKTWRDFRDSVTSRTASPPDHLNWLTGDGWGKRYPVTLPDGRMAYAFNNRRSRPGIRVFDPGTGKSSWLLRRRRISGLAYDHQNRRLVFSSLKVFRSFYLFSDLFTFHEGERKLIRWSRGGRFSEPTPVVGKPGLVCVARKGNRYQLVYMNEPFAAPVPISESFAGLSHPRISPDGCLLVAAVKYRSHNWGIGIFNSDGKLKNVLHVPDGRCSVPCWKNDREIYFILERENRSLPARIRLRNRRVSLLNCEGLAGVRDMEPGSDGGLNLVVLNSGGYDLAGLHRDRVNWSPLDSTWKIPRETNGVADSPESRPYKISRELGPKYLSPDVDYPSGEARMGVRTSGSDLPGHYTYNARLLYGFRTGKWSSQLQVTVNRFHPLLTLTLRREHLFLGSRSSGNFTLTNRFLNLVAAFPLVARETFRWDLEAGFHLNRIQDRSHLHSEGEAVELNGISLSLFLRSARRYYDAISYSDGSRLKLMASFDIAGIGGSSSARSLALDWRKYVAIVQPNVLALRLAVAHSWGYAPRLFYLGGTRSPEDVGLVEGGLFSLLRGFPGGVSAGFGGWQLNLELRLHFFKIERAFPIGPSFDRVYLTLFCDSGNMWNQRLKMDPTLSWGAEVNLIMHLGAPVHLAIGVAFSTGLNRGPALYLRIGESF